MHRGEQSNNAGVRIDGDRGDPRADRLQGLLGGDLGSDDAKFHLGLCQYFGSGCDEDEDAAFTNFSEALEEGVEKAAYMIGRCFYFGQGTPRNYVKAAECFEACAETNAVAAFYLGECHRNGTGKKKDYKHAFEWYLKSAEQETDNA